MSQQLMGVVLLNYFPSFNIKKRKPKKISFPLNQFGGISTKHFVATYI